MCDRGEDITTPAPAPAPAGPERLVTLRAVVLGLAGVVAIAAIAPFNDYVLRNTQVIGSFLPLGLLMWILLLVLAVNAPLRRFAPRWALRPGELVVITVMVLVACAIPTVGLMRYLPGHLVSFWDHASVDPSARQLMQQLDLPDWIFPSFESSDPIDRANEPVVRGFLYGSNRGGEGVAGALQAVPWSAWVRPALTWGLLVAMLYATFFSLMCVFRHQWVENERLPFPLAQVYLSLIEPPERGRALNTLLSSKWFWIAAGSVFALHALNGLAAYFPGRFPAIPLSYNLWGLFTDGPLQHLQDEAKAQRVQFVIVGLCFFLRSQLSFSLWFFFVISQVIRVQTLSSGGSITGGMELDQQFGSILALAVVTLWVARHHLRAVLGQMVRAPREGEAVGRYLPYRVAGWVVVVGSAGIVAWLVAAGMSPVAATLLLVLWLTLVVVLARVVAESGMPYVQLAMEFHRPWILLASDLPGDAAVRTTVKSYFFSSWFHGMFTHDTRENFAPYASHALRVADSVTADRPRGSRPAWGIVGCIALALAVSYVASGASYLVATYNYPNSLDRVGESPINPWGAHMMPRQLVLDRTLAYVPPRSGGDETHHRPLHIALGAAVTAGLGVLRLNYVGWPLHPIGFLLGYTWALRHTFFSIFLGWLLKSLATRFGGTDLLHALRPVFIGLILGEVTAAAFWLLVAIAASLLGNTFIPMQFAPV